MKKAKYTGPSGTGVDLDVPLADGQVRPVHVDQGSEIPTEIAGVAVAAAFLDNLLEQADWTEATSPPKPPPKTTAGDSGKEG